MLKTDLSCKTGKNSRIINEIGNLMYQVDNVNVVNINLNYIITITKFNYRIVITLPREYPFKMPSSVYVNGINYKTMLIMSEKRINEYLVKYYGHECLCCSSIMCPNNWTPMTNTAFIINEIFNTIQIKKEILLRILLNTIKLKYKCEFLIMIEEYLFPIK